MGDLNIEFFEIAKWDAEGFERLLREVAGPRILLRTRGCGAISETLN